MDEVVQEDPGDVTSPGDDTPTITVLRSIEGDAFRLEAGTDHTLKELLAVLTPEQVAAQQHMGALTMPSEDGTEPTVNPGPDLALDGQTMDKTVHLLEAIRLNEQKQVDARAAEQVVT